jgi:hypothetical protein
MRGRKTFQLMRVLFISEQEGSIGAVVIGMMPEGAELPAVIR